MCVCVCETQAMTKLHEDRPSLLPRRQVMTQIFGAMVKSGLQPKDLLAWKAETHAEEIAAFTDSIMSCAYMDQVRRGEGCFADLCMMRV